MHTINKERRRISYCISLKVVKVLIESIVPSSSLAEWPNVFNCAEMDAVNQALNNGVRLDNLQLYTVYTKSGDSVAMCGNCFYSFANGNVSNAYENGFYMLGG